MFSPRKRRGSSKHWFVSLLFEKSRKHTAFIMRKGTSQFWHLTTKNLIPLGKSQSSLRTNGNISKISLGSSYLNPSQKNDTAEHIHSSSGLHEFWREFVRFWFSFWQLGIWTGVQFMGPVKILTIEGWALPRLCFFRSKDWSTGRPSLDWQGAKGDSSHHKLTASKLWKTYLIKESKCKTWESTSLKKEAVKGWENGQRERCNLEIRIFCSVATP